MSAEQSTDPAVNAYAAEYGVTEAEATRRLDRIQPIQDLLASIREVESARVAGWGIDPALQRSAEPLELRGPSGGIGPVGSTGAATAPDSATDAELAALAAQMTAAYQGHIGVAYAVVDGRNLAEDAMFDGGRSMRTCTSGFAVRHNSTGTYGIITAGHCDARQTMHGVSLPWVNGYNGTTADAQFHRIPSGSGHQLRSDYLCRQLRPLVCTAQAIEAWSAMLGDFVCHTGMRPGSSCGTVINIHYRPTNAGACYADEFNTPADCAARFVRVHGSSLKSCKGDSGGPWFSRNTAYGIHKGSDSGNKCAKTGVNAWFSAISQVESFLGVQVLVANNVTIG